MVGGQGFAGQEPEIPVNKAAQALGRLAKGVPKNFSRAERARRKTLMEAINARRQKNKSKKTT